MKKILFILSVSIAFLSISKRSDAQETSGQDHKTAVGLKFGGYENGISVKYFANPTVAFEGVLGFRDHGVVITGLYEFHQEAFGVPELKFYYGAGAHIGSESSGVYKTFDGINQTYNSSHILLGVDGVVGLEYIIP